ncbi:Ubiquitin carboxyl-terminal hydrolase 45 [Gonapodya sp. JEL0774]|nr:Ubiquitin carboxyl-terminal hydrolase 45 [Gonapodya sp. JEL0774]
MTGHDKHEDGRLELLGGSQDTADTDVDVDMPHVDADLPFDPSSFLDQKRDCPHVSAIHVARLKRILPLVFRGKGRKGCETCNKLRSTLSTAQSSQSAVPATTPHILPLTLSDLPDPPQTLWLCLTCASLNCGRADLAHSVAHFDTTSTSTSSQPLSQPLSDLPTPTGHPLVMNLETGQSWCYACDAEILSGPACNTTLAECYEVVRAQVKSAGGVDGPMTSSLAEVVAAVYARAAGGYVAGTAGASAAAQPAHHHAASFLKPPISFPLTRSKSHSPPPPAPTSPAHNHAVTPTLGSPPLDPTPLFRALSTKWPMYRTMRQQDAHEVLRRVVEGCGGEQRASVGSTGEGGKEGEGGTGKVKAKDERTVVEDVFAGELVSVVVCEVCKNVSFSQEPILDLLLPIYSPTDPPPLTAPSFLAEYLSHPNPDPLYPLAHDQDHLRYVDRLLRPGRAEDRLRTPVVGGVGTRAGASTPAGADEVTVVGCLDRFLAVERLDGAEKINCENCQRIHHPDHFDAETHLPLAGHPRAPAEYRPAYKRLVLLDRLPPVLVVGLKRFQTVGYTGRTRKVQEWIRFPQVVELRDVTVSKGELRIPEGTHGGGRSQGGGDEAGQERGRAGKEGKARLGRDLSQGDLDSEPANKKSRSLSHGPVTVSVEHTGVVTRSRSAAKGSGATSSGSSSPSSSPPRTSTTPAGPTHPHHLHRPNTPRPISPSLIGPDPDADTTFQLRGVVVHSGYQLASGHYYAYVRVPMVRKAAVQTQSSGDDMEVDMKNSTLGEGDGDGEMEDVWVYASDTDVRVTDWEEVKKAQAFMLFFERL